MHRFQGPEVEIMIAARLLVLLVSRDFRGEGSTLLPPEGGKVEG